MKLLSQFLWAILAGISVSASGTAETPDTSEYGVCAHVGTNENAIASREFPLMREAGIRCVRADFRWHDIEPEKGKWKFDHLDRVVREAKANRITLLPILSYSVPWAQPSQHHLSEWLEYVRRVVTRYRNDIRTWEVWNEPNLSNFWDGTPDAAEYATLLKATYETIKAIDPQLTVVQAGMAGVDLGYIEGLLQAGAGNSFDVMNIHPYRWDSIPETLPKDLDALRSLMNKYGIGKKPVWITELGWPTSRPRYELLQGICRSFFHAGKIPENATIAFVRDPDYGMTPFFKPEKLFPEARIRHIRYREIAELDPRSIPVLIPCYNESFPMLFFDQLEGYVRKGGTVIFPAGAPLYFDLKRHKDGHLEEIQVGDEYRNRLHLNLDAWWYPGSKAPRQNQPIRPAAPYKNFFHIPPETRACRFMTGKMLRGKDRFVPVIIPTGTDYPHPAAAFHDLDSDLKGNVGVIALLQLNLKGYVSEEKQAELLPRAILTALAEGIEKFFWYEFQAVEEFSDDPESHFGIVHRDLSPKPAYFSYRALTAQRPEGSSRPEISTYPDGLRQAAWNRPDGTKVVAFWTENGTVPCRLNIRGEGVAMTDHLGKTLEFSSRFTASPAIIYFSGKMLQVTRIQPGDKKM